MRRKSAIYGMMDEDDEDDEPVLGRNTLKMRSKEILNNNTNVRRSFTGKPYMQPPQSYMQTPPQPYLQSPPPPPPQPTQPPSRSQWNLTPEMMNQPWGELLRTLFCPHPLTLSSSEMIVVCSPPGQSSLRRVPPIWLPHTSPRFLRSHACCGCATEIAVPIVPQARYYEP